MVGKKRGSAFVLIGKSFYIAHDPKFLIRFYRYFSEHSFKIKYVFDWSDLEICTTAKNSTVSVIWWALSLR